MLREIFFPFKAAMGGVTVTHRVLDPFIRCYGKLRHSDQISFTSRRC